jgi:hypothetical protein
MYGAKVLADSLSPDGVRLTTLEVTFPRFILAEVNTHRMLSRNSASSRAIPTEKQIDRVLNHPFIPEFNKRVTGMGVGEPLEPRHNRRMKSRWLQARDAAVSIALLMLEVDKSRANRLLEPFMWHTAIISATEWDNFFALRDHKDAQPEFQITARLMREAMEASAPRSVGYEQWHLPLVDPEEINGQALGYTDPWVDWETWSKVSASRCARVSYDTHWQEESLHKTLERYDRLVSSGHLSPLEHVARPMKTGTIDNQFPDLYFHGPKETFAGNFCGWVQLRKAIPNEDNFGRID